MAKPNKFFGNSPNPAVALPAWGMLIMALALVFLPSLRTAALILYAADWLALGIAALTAKRKQSLVNYWGSCVPIVVAIVLLSFWYRRYTTPWMRNIFLVALGFVLLTLPMLLIAEKQVPNMRAGREKYWLRAVALTMLVFLAAISWAAASNITFDQSAGSLRTACITEKWRNSSRTGGQYHIRVAVEGLAESLNFDVGRDAYRRLSEGDAVTVTAYDGFWGAPYYDVTLPKSQKEN